MRANTLLTIYHLLFTGQAVLGFIGSTFTSFIHERQRHQINQASPPLPSLLVLNTQTDADAAGDEDEDDDTRDVSTLEKWAADNNIQVSPSITITSSHDATTDATSTAADDDEDIAIADIDYGITLNKSSKKYESILTVPKHLVLDSERIRREWFIYLEESLDYIRDAGLNDSGLNFVLFVKILVEYTMGEESIFYPWITSLPKTYSTGVCMDDLEKSCLPPFALAIANFEQQQYEIFCNALNLMIQDGDEDDEDGDENVFPFLRAQDINDDLCLWAFNVITTRCWRYAQDDNDNDIVRPIAVPFGDMFNHREPPNVMVKDSDSFDSVEFILSEDVNVDNNNDGTGTGTGLYLSYGLTNPHRFLCVFGFVDESMPEVFSQLLFNNPTPELILLGCNDRSKMVYRTADGGVSVAVWDCVLHTLLAQVPEEQDEFYTAHLEGNGAVKSHFHQKYALEESLTLRNHVEGTAKEYKTLIDKIDAMASNGAYDYHKHLKMIRRHNEFLYEIWMKVLDRIKHRAMTETRRRKEEED